MTESVTEPVELEVCEVVTDTVSVTVVVPDCVGDTLFDVEIEGEFEVESDIPAEEVIVGEGEAQGDTVRLTEGVAERVPDPLPVSELNALDDCVIEFVAVVE